MLRILPISVVVVIVRSVLLIQGYLCKRPTSDLLELHLQQSLTGRALLQIPFSFLQLKQMRELLAQNLTSILPVAKQNLKYALSANVWRF